MNGINRISGLAIMSAIGLCATPGSAAIDVIYTEIDGHPTARVPGAVDLSGTPISTEFKAMEDLALSPDGSQWILKGRNEADSDFEAVMLLGSGTSGTVFAQEGQPVGGGAPGEVYDFFDGTFRFNENNDFAFGARARGGVAAEFEKVIRFDGIYTIVVQSDAAALGLIDQAPNPSGDELFGNSMNSVHLLNDGTVGFVAVTITNVHSSRRPAIFYDHTAFAQSGVTAIDGNVWDSFDSDDFRTTPDGTRWLAQGDDEGATSSDDILVVDGVVEIRENSVIGASGITAIDIFHTKLLANGDWYARGDDPLSNDWAVRNGVVIAATGDSVEGGAESWTDVILAFNGNTGGDYVLAGRTTAADPLADAVIALNGEEVIVRENDPIDLDGNGVFDDDVFIGRGNEALDPFRPDDVWITNDGDVYFIASLRNAAGDDLGVFGTGGDAFLRLQLCPSDTDGNGMVDVDDLVNVIIDWGTDGSANGGDVDGSGLVDVDDLVQVILDWGDC